MGQRRLSANLWVSAAVGQYQRWLVEVADGSRHWSLFFSFFFFLFWWLWIVGSVIRGRHRWWSPAWEALLASLLAWR